MSTTYIQYCKYLRHLLEVECAEKHIDFDQLVVSYIHPQHATKMTEQPKESSVISEPQKSPNQLEEERQKAREEERRKAIEEEKRKEEKKIQHQEEKEPKKKEKKNKEESKTKEARTKNAKEGVQISRHADLSFDDGYYIGETKNGLMHGQGTRYWDRNGRKWEGTWIEGEASGHIKVSFDDFLAYDGQMQHNLPNGYGVYTDINNGQRYEGDFVNGERQGEGVLYSESGDKIYEGEWERNKYNGYGQYFLRGQCRYEGYWLNGKRNEQGIAYDAEGNVEYDGEWKDDIRLNDIDRIKTASEG